MGVAQLEHINICSNVRIASLVFNPDRCDAIANDGSNATGAMNSSSAVPSLNLDVPVRPPGNPAPVPKGVKKAKAS